MTKKVIQRHDPFLTYIPSARDTIRGVAARPPPLPRDPQHSRDWKLRVSPRPSDALVGVMSAGGNWQRTQQRLG